MQPKEFAVHVFRLRPFRRCCLRARQLCAHRRGRHPDHRLGLPALRCHLRRGHGVGRRLLPARCAPGALHAQLRALPARPRPHGAADHRGAERVRAQERPAEFLRRDDRHARPAAVGFARSAPGGQPLLRLRRALRVDRQRGAARARPAPEGERGAAHPGKLGRSDSQELPLERPHHGPARRARCGRRHRGAGRCGRQRGRGAGLQRLLRARRHAS